MSTTGDGKEDAPRPDGGAEIVTLVMDGGTAYVMHWMLRRTIHAFDTGDPLRGVAREFLIHAHDEIAGQIRMPLYEDWLASAEGRLASDLAQRTPDPGGVSIPKDGDV